MRESASVDDAQLQTDLLERIECELQLVAAMRGGDNRADARCVAGDGRKRDALREHPFCEEPVGERHRKRAVTEDDRRDRALAEAGVEPQRLEACLEEARVIPEPLDDLRFLDQYVERGNTRRRDRRWM